MKKTTKTEEPASLVETEEEHEEEYTGLTYTIGKLVIIVRDNARVHIDNLMSGKPKDGPP
jgi:hypothetical protein